MILAMLRVMALSVIRDRGALAMAFLLPPTIFVIFAAIFSGTSGDELRLQVALGVAEPTALTDRLEEALRNEPSLRLLPVRDSSREEVARRVEAGQADVGLFIAGNLAATDEAPMSVLVDPGKVVAGAVLSGQVQRIVASDLPDLALSRTAPLIGQIVGGFSPAQSAQLDAAVAALAEDTGAADDQSALVEVEPVGPGGGVNATVTYYAGAVAILFLLFSAMQGAATLIEERNAGIVDRVAVGPAGTDVVVIGKFLFLTLQGVIQVAIIFIVANIFYSVDVLPRFGPWALTTIIAAAAASGLGLAVASACTSKQQAQTVSTFVVLVCSAIGGSMVPRFMMPPWLQDIGWYTPNAWTIEAYQGVLWRGDALTALLPQLGWLAALAIVSAAFAVMVSRLRLRL
jgi:ABC-2 type transport system permease protein